MSLLSTQHPKYSSTSKHINSNSLVYVDRTDVLDDLILDTKANSKKKYVDSNKYHQKSKRDDNDIGINKLKELSVAKENHLLNQSKKQLHKYKQLQAKKQDARYHALLDDMEASKETLNEIDKQLNLFHETNHNKQRHQYEDWNTNVHGKIQQEISKKVDSLNDKELNERKGADYNKFLAITNRKPAIFLDIIIESEYDPLEPNTKAIDIMTNRLKDSTHVSQQKYEDENRMLGNDNSTSNSSNTMNNTSTDGNVTNSLTNIGNKKPKKNIFKTKTKEVLPIEQWASGKIEGTPYGSFAKLMTKNKTTEGNGNTVTNGNPNKMKKGGVVFDHYDFPKGKEALEAEMPKGKRIHPATIYANPSRVFNSLPVSVQEEIAAIHPPENKGWNE